MQYSAEAHGHNSHVDEAFPINRPNTLKLNLPNLSNSPKNSKSPKSPNFLTHFFSNFRKRTPKDSKTETPEPQPNYITAILPTESTNNKNYKNQYGGHSNCLRWSQDEVDLQHTIKTPSRICEKEWLATHILSLSNNIKLLYELIGPYCTPSTCPKMCGVRGELFYQEKEGAGNKRETHVFSAPGYADWAFQKLTEIAEDQEYRKFVKNMD